MKSYRTELILEMIEKGKTVPEIATALNVSRNLVRQAILRNQPQSERLADKERALDEARQSEPRDPCLRCGVPAFKHDEHGCKRWRPAP